MELIRQTLSRIDATLDQTREWTGALTSTSDNLVAGLDSFASRIRSA